MFADRKIIIKVSQFAGLLGLMVAIYACGDKLTEPRSSVALPRYSTSLSPEDSLPMIAVSPSTSLLIQYTDSSGTPRSEVIPGDSLALYPIGLSVQYQLIVPTGQRGAITLNDSLLAHSGTVSLQVGEVLWAQSAMGKAWSHS